MHGSFSSTSAWPAALRAALRALSLLPYPSQHIQNTMPTPQGHKQKRKRKKEHNAWAARTTQLIVMYRKWICILVEVAGHVLQSSSLDVISQPDMVVIHNLLHTNFKVVLGKWNELPSAENLTDTDTCIAHQPLEMTDCYNHTTQQRDFPNTHAPKHN